MLCLKTSVTRRHRRLQSWFFGRLIRESLTFQTTPKSAPEAFMAPSYGFILSKHWKITNTKSQFSCVFQWFYPQCVPKIAHNSAWWTPPELIFASFDSWESPLSNDKKISAWGVHGAELWTHIEKHRKIPDNSRLPLHSDRIRKKRLKKNLEGSWHV